MAKRTRKPTNKAKFSIYVDRTIMKKTAKAGEPDERSVNYMVEKALEEKYSTVKL